MGDIFGVVKISIIFGGCLKFLIFFAGREPTYEEKMRVPPSPTPWIDDPSIHIDSLRLRLSIIHKDVERFMISIS